MFFHVNTRNGCVVLTCSSVKHSFKGRDGSTVEPDRETGEEQITVGWAHIKDGR